MVGRKLGAGLVVALLTSVLVLVGAPAAHALPSCPQLDGWVGPVTSTSSYENAYGGVVYCTYTKASLGELTYASIQGNWVGDAEQSPSAVMTNGGCGRATDPQLSERVLSSSGTWSKVLYGIGGAGYTEGEAILVAELEAFQQAVGALLAQIETYAKSCTETVDDGTDTGTTYPTERTAGTNRYETATQIADSWDSADVVFVATGLNFPDALGGGPAAAAYGAPILLVEQGSIPSTTVAELQRLTPDVIIALGGTAAISESTLSALGAYAGSVQRVAGVNRYLTAVAVSQLTFEGPEPVVYLAPGRSFADPIIAGAAAALDGAPLLLTDGQSALETAVAAELARLQPSQIILVGADSDLTGALAGLSAIAPVTQVNQSDIYSRSAALWDDVTGPVHEVVLATSGSFADALAGTPYAALPPVSYLMLTRSDCVPAVVRSQVQRLDPDGLMLLGGTAALSASVASLTSC